MNKVVLFNALLIDCNQTLGIWLTDSSVCHLKSWKNAPENVLYSSKLRCIIITCLNDWRPVALTPIFSKCFEKLVRDYICSVLPASLDPLQFAYRSNRSTDDAIAFTLHTALSHLENKNTYVRMLFVDYSSAFNTIVHATLVAKLQTLGLNRSLCS